LHFTFELVKNENDFSGCFILEQDLIGLRKKIEFLPFENGGESLPSVGLWVEKKSLMSSAESWGGSEDERLCED
jgi:hypothetical protein